MQSVHEHNASIEFELPAELEARVPPEARGLARDEVRLLVSTRNGGVTLGATFRDLPLFLNPGDVIVVNDSATLPAALTASRDDGSTFALHLSTRVPPSAGDRASHACAGGIHYVVEPRRTSVRGGERVALPGRASATFLARYRGSARLWVACIDLGLDLLAYLRRYGKPIAYPYVEGAWPIETYQTVYAAQPGSAEMPSAGRGFSPRLIDALREKDIAIVPITLHTGVASLESHEPPYPEWYRVPATACDAVNAARRRGSRVVATGTTVVRALESATADGRGVLRPASGWTDLVIAPDQPVRTVDGLITGFHEPRASHLQMLEALAGRTQLQRAYAAALRARMRWHEFGDLHLIL